MALQGFSPKILRLLPAEVVTKAAGNAYPVPLIIAVVHPVLVLMGSTPGFDLATWPKQVSRRVPLEIVKMVSALKGRDRQAVPKKASKASNASKAILKRCSSDSECCNASTKASKCCSSDSD